jgi:lipoprotein-releasing system ATP-binding protein
MSMILQTEHVTRRLAGDVPVTLVQEVNVQVQEGEFVAIVGPSGSGKSSLLYLLGLLDRPTTGKLWLADQETSTLSDDKRADLRLLMLGFVFQFHFLLPEFSAIENVMLPMQRLGKLSAAQMRARGLELLEALGLGAQAEKLPRQLSGGQAQRVAIARAMANQPRVILADEPTGNLDTASSANVQKILRDLAHHQGQSVVAVTHDPAFAQTADRVIHIVDGRVQ